MTALKIVSGLISVFLTATIWLYLLYQILVRVEASELMWFLYWAYCPFVLLVYCVNVIMTKDEKP